MRVVEASLEDIFVTLTLHIMSVQAAEQQAAANGRRA
jgi:hypothetical protein